MVIMRIILLILLSVAVAFSQTPTIKTVSAPRWQYQGTYKAGDVLADLCDRTGCTLGLSGEVVDLPITLSVKTSSKSVLLASLRNALLFSGYYLQGSLTGNLSVYRDGTMEQAVFVDRNLEVQTVPKSYLWAYQKADSLKAWKDDSLSKILPEETKSKRWRFEFVSISDNASKSYGLEVSHPLAYGNISVTHPLNNSHLAQSWNLDYLSSIDSLFEFRAVSFDLDSLLEFSWGVQRQVLEKTFFQDGIQTNSYEWRQYGLDLKLNAYPKMKMAYTLRSPDESTISGSSALGRDSSIYVVAHYDMNQAGESCFLPLLPIFCKPSIANEKRYFILHLYPLEDDYESPKLRN